MKTKIISLLVLFFVCIASLYPQVGGTQRLEIGNNAFQGAVVSQGMALPPTLSVIGNNAFYNITIPCLDFTRAIGLQQIRSNAFYNAKLTSLNLLDFRNCVLLSCYISGTQSGSSFAGFSGEILYPFELEAMLKENSLETIGNSAFQGATIGSIEFVGSINLTNIGTSAFQNVKLTEDKSISFSHSRKLESVGNSAFQNSSIEMITLPDSLVTIGSNAFAGCIALDRIVSHNTEPPTLGTTVFTGVDTLTCKLEVPEKAMNAYGTAEQWRAFLNRYIIGTYKPVTGVKLASDSLVLMVGDTLTMRASIQPADANNKNLTWTSSNTAVASIDESGKITALSAGVSSIIVKTEDGGKADTCALRVDRRIVLPVSVSLDRSSINMTVGDNDKLTATVLPADADNKSVVWASSDPLVASVDQAGEVSAISPGTATIGVTTVEGGKTASCSVNVSQLVVSPSAVSLNQASLSLAVGGNGKLTATVYPEDATNKNVTWTSSNPAIASVDENGNITALSPGTATITATTQDGNKTAACQVSVSENIPVPEFSDDQNYVRKITYTQESTVYDHRKAVEQVQYFDGLGRPVQTVQVSVTPEGNSLADYLQYDDFGREGKAWLPTISSNNGRFESLSAIEQKAWAQYRDSAYSRPVYEASPLNRILEEYGPGKEWYMATAGKGSVRTSYLTNDASNALSCIHYAVTGNRNEPVLTKLKDIYDSGELYVTQVSDEQGNTSYEFKDKLGQVVLTRQIGDRDENGNEKHDTYYVYDDYGNLCFVLPPKAADSPFVDSNMQNFVYQYRYDERNRCTAKKIPGADWVNYIYDKADRLVFSQDGEQALKRQWMFTLNDALGRMALTGICNNDLRAADFAGKAVTARYSGEGPFEGYVIENFSPENYKLLTVNYYDRYADAISGFEGKGLEYKEAKVIDGNVRYGSATGLLTATKVRTLAADQTQEVMLLTAMYHDLKGRVVQSHSTNHLGGTDSEYFAYNFSGQPLVRRHEQSIPHKDLQTEEYAYNYHRTGRLISSSHRLNGEPAVVLAANVYDELGRLESTTANNNSSLKTAYEYTIRSWTKTIANKHYSQSMDYMLNGNVLQMKWSQNGAKEQAYVFDYDKLSRLKAATYSGDGNFSSAYTYDKHGNMLTLLRYGIVNDQKQKIDELNLGYKGNQLVNTTQGVQPVLKSGFSQFISYYQKTGDQYLYNANGAMTKDNHKGITITHNSLNLPSDITINNENAKARNEYIYSASGSKLQIKRLSDKTLQRVPLQGATPENSGDIDQTVTDYVANVIYEDNQLKRILLDNAYIENRKYYFYVKDHLGNNRLVLDDTGSVLQSNQYYPFGLEFADGKGKDKQPYKYGGKELDSDHNLNLYDFAARYYDPAIPRFTSIDPMAEKYYSISPYAYVANNPLKYIDPTGMAYGDFIDDKGKIIGNDGINDNKIYVLRNEALNSKELKSTKNFIKNNSGKTDAFKQDNIAYQNSIEIESSSKARQDMVNEVSKDNGKGGTKDANNREYGGYIKEGIVKTVTPGDIANPKTDANASIELPFNNSTFHSHPSGHIVESSGSGVIGGSTITYSFQQSPSTVDISNAGTQTHYVFGRSSGNVYIYNAQGTQSSIPMKHFVTPKK